MVDDTTRKLSTAIKNLQHDVKRLLSGRWLENASVRGGRLRFIGGVLRLDSGALLDLIGQWRFRGNGAITGDVYSEGRWTQVGPWDFTGTGRVYGSVEVLDNGRIKVGNVIISPEGNGKITVGVGAAQVVIDGATGKITAGNMTIDPTVSGGAMVFANGAQVFTDASTIQVFKGNSVVQVSNAYARIQYGGSVVEISADGIRATGMGTKTLASTPGGFVNALVYDAGWMKRIV